MFTTFKHLLIITIATLAFFACGKVEDADNEITDAEGVTISLTWSNTAANPAEKTDLDFSVRKDFNTLLSSTNFGEFESITVTPSLLNDGTYSLEVYVDDIDRVTNYTIKIEGKSTKKTYEKSFGPINASDTNSRLKPLSLTVEANKFSVY